MSKISRIGFCKVFANILRILVIQNMTIYGTEFLLDIVLDNVNYLDKNTKMPK